MNWGKKIVMAMALFMIFIMALGAMMISRNSKDALIEEDYYEKGQLYDKDYLAKKAALDDKVVPNIVVTNYGIIITFPVPVQYEVICRRPSDAGMDRTISGYTDGDRDIRILNGALQPGPWLLRIQYTYENKSYLLETEVIMP